MEKRGGRGLGFEPRGFIIVVDDCQCVIWSRRVVGTFSTYQVTINEKKNYPLNPSQSLHTSQEPTNIVPSNLDILRIVSVYFSLNYLFCFVFPDRALFRIYFHKLSQNGYSFNDNVSHRYFISKKKKKLLRVYQNRKGGRENRRRRRRRS